LLKISHRDAETITFGQKLMTPYPVVWWQTKPILTAEISLVVS
jgi:hypothetical protein